MIPGYKLQRHLRVCATCKHVDIYTDTDGVYYCDHPMHREDCEDIGLCPDWEPLQEYNKEPQADLLAALGRLLSFVETSKAEDVVALVEKYEKIRKSDSGSKTN